MFNMFKKKLTLAVFQLPRFIREKKQKKKKTDSLKPDIRNKCVRKRLRVQHETGHASECSSLALHPNSLSLSAL